MRAGRAPGSAATGGERKLAGLSRHPAQLPGTRVPAAAPPAPKRAVGGQTKRPDRDYACVPCPRRAPSWGPHKSSWPCCRASCPSRKRRRLPRPAADWRGSAAGARRIHGEAVQVAGRVERRAISTSQPLDNNMDSAGIFNEMEGCTHQRRFRFRRSCSKPVFQDAPKCALGL